MDAQTRRDSNPQCPAPYCRVYQRALPARGRTAKMRDGKSLIKALFLGCVSCRIRMLTNEETAEPLFGTTPVSFR